MAAKKYQHEKKKKNRSKRAFASCSPHIFPTLVSQICSQKGLKLQVLKTLYYLLTCLSLNASVNSSNCEVSYNCFDKEYYQCGFTVKFSEICGLSDVLFERLDNRFNQLFYAFRDHVSTSLARELPVLGCNLSESIEELTLLLRCCMVILTLLVSDQNQLIQKGQVLLLILSRLISTDLSSRSEETSVIRRKLVPCEFEHVEDGCTAPALEGFVASLCLSGSSNPLRTILSSLLEVFADELLMLKSLREYFVLIDSASSISEMLFMCHIGQDDIGTVLEVISAHFILSVSNQQAFEGFLNRLFWQHDDNFRIPEMSLTASLSLLLNPIILSAPKMLQAYLILLVSEAIGIGMSSNYLKPDPGNMDWYLTAFERSLILYARYMSNFHTDGHPIGSNNSTVKPCMLGSNQLACESFLQPATRKKINHLITNLNHSWDSYANNRSARKKSDLVDASITYAKESLYLFDKQCGDKILSMLTSILRGSSDDIHSTVLYNEGRSFQEIYLLASILKLMSSSMLQAIWCLRRNSGSGYLKTLQDVLLRKKYDFLAHLIGGFRQFNIYQPIQRLVSDMMKTYPTRHKKSKWMLLHLLGLLSSSYVSGVDFLVKNCIFTMTSLLNLFVFEEGDLDALSSLINSRLESMSSKSSDKIRKVLTEQRSSKRIASKFQKAQKLCLSKRSLTSFHRRNNDKQTGTSENASILNHMDSPISMEEETAEVCNGEIFLKCLQDSFNTSSDIDDLADFIECKPGKDYSVWLKDRQRFRKWQLKRKAVNKCQTQKKKWKYNLYKGK